MKIAVNTENNDLLNEFIKTAKEEGHQIIVAKVERVLFEHIEACDVDAFVLSNDSLYFKKAVDFIKKSNPYTPVIGIMPSGIFLPVIIDMYMDLSPVLSSIQKSFTISSFVRIIFYNINSYIKTFAVLKRLTAKMHDKIEFANCIYDPTRRLLYYKDKEVKKLSAKEGGILEILASNYGEVVKKDVILEKVWRKNDYFAGRSMDVYITYLRNTLRNNKIKLSIKNISGIGLILE